MSTTIEYLLFRLIGWLARLMPYGAARHIGHALGLGVLYLTGYRKRITLDNLTRAFPDASPAWVRRVMRGAYKNYGSAIVEMFWAGGRSAETLKAKVHLGNPEVLYTALQRNAGLILMSAHFGSWEFMLNGLRLHIPAQFAAIVQRQRNERIDAFIDKQRRRFDVETIALGPSVREVLRALQEKKVVVILGDQSGPRESVFIPFFGRPSATHRGAAAFALRTGAPIVLVLLVRRPDGSHEAVFEEVPTGGLSGTREERVTQLTARHAAVLEKHIRLHPEHWLWMHKRWKHKPQQEEDHAGSVAHGGQVGA
jgi:Kdo2-lipid IVA lauroyltransferase/acyltransferase